MSDKTKNNGASNGASDVNKIISTEGNGATPKSGIKKSQMVAGRVDDIRVLIKGKHTSPNKETIIEVFKGQPKQIDGFDDLDGIAKMLGYHASEVDELLTTLQKGVKGPPYHEELIQYIFKDGAIRALPSGSTNLNKNRIGEKSNSGPGSSQSGPGSSNSGPGSSQSGPGSSKSGPGSSKSGPDSSKSGPESSQNGQENQARQQEDMKKRNTVVTSVVSAIKLRLGGITK